MKFVFQAQSQIRQNVWKAVEGFSDEQLHIIPQGYNNNLIWNIGHIVATQQILCYKLGAAPMLLPESFINLFKKDTSPRDWTKPADVKEIREYFSITTGAFAGDYDKKIFSGYKEYKTSSGIVLNNIDEALIYNYGHENLHYGVVLNMRKLIK